MSVYSGFATRQQETFYDKLLLKTLQLLSARIIQIYKTDIAFDEVKWAKQIRKLSKYMMLMDQNKWLQPKFSETLVPLGTFLKEIFSSELQNENDRLSSLTTDLSAFVDVRSDLSIIMNSNKSQQNAQHSPIQQKSLNQNESPSKMIQIQSASFMMNRGVINDRQSANKEQKSFSLLSKEYLNGEILKTQDRSLPKIAPINTSLMENLAKDNSKSKRNRRNFINHRLMTSIQQRQPSKVKRNRNHPSNSLVLQNFKTQAQLGNQNILEEQEEDNEGGSMPNSSKRAEVKQDIRDVESQPILFKSISQNDGISQQQQQNRRIIKDQYPINHDTNKALVSVNSFRLDNRKYSSQPRGTFLKKSIDKTLPDISQVSSKLDQKISALSRNLNNRRLSSISSHSSKSSNRILLKSQNSGQNKLRRQQLKQSYQNSFVMKDLLYNTNSTNTAISNMVNHLSKPILKSKYVKNFAQLDAQQPSLEAQLNTYDPEMVAPQTAGTVVGQNSTGLNGQNTRCRKKGKRHLNKSALKTSNNQANMMMQQQQQSFVSPMRAIASAAVPTNQMRGMSNSPYTKKKPEVQRRGHQLSIQKSLAHREYSGEDDINRMISLNQITTRVEDAAKYHEIIESEKIQFKKKENASREIIAEISRKLKQTEKKAIEESKMVSDIKKRHEQMKKKLEKAQKEKLESINQLKSLFVLFTQQRKALELSIQKTKKLEEDNMRYEHRNRNLEEQHKIFFSRIEQLEADREMLINKQKREREHMEVDMEERRQYIKKLENEFRDFGNQKALMKKQLDEYEMKIKKLIIEFEEESKKHIRELNDVHEQYRGYKSASLEMEQRVMHYNQEAQKAMNQERESKRDAHRLRLENDELREKARFLEERYNMLIERLENGGATEEEIQALEQLVQIQSLQGVSPDKEAHIISQGKQKRKSSQKSRLDDNEKSQDRRSQDSRLKQRQDDSYQMQQHQQQVPQRNLEPTKLEDYESDEGIRPIIQQNQKQAIPGVISGEQTIEKSDRRSSGQKGNFIQGPSNFNHPQKHNMIEVLDEEEGAHFYGNNGDSQQESDEENDLLKKLIENIGGNPALQNVYVREKFQLEKIKKEEDLHNYKNLLNSMAALFYTNHKMNEVTLLFYVWKESALAKQKERILQIDQQQKTQPQKKQAVPQGIKIDTDLANQDTFTKYQKQHLIDDDEDSPSEIAQDLAIRQNMMMNIENDNSNMLKDEEEYEDADLARDKQTRNFLDELRKIGPFSKQILNYSYPPLLYQRGEEEEDEEELEEHMLPALGPDFDEDEDQDQDIQELIKGTGIKNEDLYAQQKQPNAQRYIEEIDDDGNVYLVEAMSQEDYDYGAEEMDGYEDDEEFLAMMEQQAANQIGHHLEQNSTIINSSQNTSLEDNFVVQQ